MHESPNLYACSVVEAIAPARAPLASERDAQCAGGWLRSIQSSPINSGALLRMSRSIARRRIGADAGSFLPRCFLDRAFPNHQEHDRPGTQVAAISDWFRCSDRGCA